jgi:hypothetical protein
MLTTTGRAASMTHEMAMGSRASARVNALAPVMQAKSRPISAAIAGMAGVGGALARGL